MDRRTRIHNEMQAAVRQGNLHTFQRLSRGRHNNNFNMLHVDVQFSLLATACRYNRQIIICYMIHNLHMDVNRPASNGKTAVVVATEANTFVSLATVALLVNQCKACCDTTGVLGPLEASIRCGNHDVTRYLVRNGYADPNRSNHQGDTPLSVAVKIGSLHTLRILVLECKVDLEKHNIHDSGTLIGIAASSNQYAVVQCLVEELGVHVDHCGSDGRTALIIASTYGDTVMVTLLVDTLKADTNHVDLNGVTALIAAADNGHGTLLRYLVETPGTLRYVQAKMDGQMHTALSLVQTPRPWRAVEALAGTGTRTTLVRWLKRCCQCDGCPHRGRRRCSMCNTVRYCSVECQRNDWKQHGQICTQKRSSSLGVDTVE
jgi:ankyrin repeat protein